MPELTEAQLSACRVISRRFGEPADVWPHVTWGASVVVGARLVDGAEVVVKASGEHSVAVEADTLRLAAEVGVPVPPVLAEGTDEDLPGGRWMALRKARGRPWALPDRTTDASARTQDDVGRVFALLHARELPGRGPLTEARTGSHGRWSDWLRESIDPWLRFLQSEGHYDGGLVTRVNRLFSSRACMLDDRPGVLVHGDLGNMEIFVDESDRVVDIVDFGKTGVGDPVYDFVRFCGGGPIDDPRPDALLPRVRRSYIAHGGVEPANWEELFRIYSVYNAVDNSAWSIREDIPWLPGLRRKVGDLLDLLETGNGAD